ncbi:hypothetical protein E4T66_15920 [Sinimarinibacterium sp. CAU 1509]|uniref:hypothetical protein n=1 Tax=Sinimarinibacterium sp. CAU 1509 TaxID=2562283 RepID=UPI0010AD8643|nr:hypothetical protein [Sinimarinibacterium sp. CAU 1509]TJY58183.1 hypothetical protein E4T66_15920 [Sinimarinibacterium sp. CAU 1509]
MKSRIVALLLLMLPALAGASSNPDVGRLADIDIIDRHSGQALPMYRHDGRWYLAGDPGREYEIRIRNRSNERIMAVTSVDGVNVITGQTASAGQSGYVIDRRDRVDIEGWRKSLSRVARFYFTDLDDSYAARTRRPDNVGAIGVALFRERRVYRYDDDRRVPQIQRERDDARGPSVQSKRAEPQLGTGHGRSARSSADYVEFERASKRPAEVLTIYYDSVRNLQAHGIIPRSRGWASRLPEPFPGRFAPDPWD